MSGSSKKSPSPTSASEESADPRSTWNELDALDRLIVEALPEAGVYAVGGRVRDEVLRELGRAISYAPDADYLVTGMPLDAILGRLREHGRADLVGASFGVIKFVSEGRSGDVALPRRERSTGAHHRDFEVESSPDIPIEEDLARRDFRINMLARDLRTGRLLDPYGGAVDAREGRLDALRREAFLEDPLRVLRGAQIAARFELTPTPLVLEGMRAAAGLIPTVAPERVAAELTKLFERAPRPSVGLEILRDVGALPHILPELLEGWGVDQNEYHAFTVYYHSLAACDAAPPDLALRLAALLHDVAKPRTKEGPHFYRHEIVGEEMTEAALERLRFPNELVERVAGLVRNHMYNTDPAQTDAAIRRFIRRVGERSVDDLFALRAADIAATGLPERRLDDNAAFERRVRAELQAERALGVTDLAIDGAAVIAEMRDLGLVGSEFTGDRRVGAALAYCLEQVTDDPARNRYDVLRALVREYFST